METLENRHLLGFLESININHWIAQGIAKAETEGLFLLGAWGCAFGAGYSAKLLKESTNTGMLGILLSTECAWISLDALSESSKLNLEHLGNPSEHLVLATALTTPFFFSFGLAANGGN